MTTTPAERPIEQRQQQTLEARRRARHKFAKDRIRKIVNGMPEFTPEQTAELVAIIHGGSSE